MISNHIFRQILLCLLVLALPTIVLGQSNGPQTPSWSSPAFAAKNESEVVRLLFAGQSIAKDAEIDIQLPMQSSGMAVPVRIIARGKPIDSLAIVSNEGTFPLIVAARFTSPVRGYTTHVLLQKSGRVTAYVSSAGSLYRKSSDIKVNIGGYGMRHEQLRSIQDDSDDDIVETRISSRQQAGGREILAMIGHAAKTDTGNQHKSSAIRSIEFRVNDTTLAEIALGRSVPVHPMNRIIVPAARAGDSVTVQWTDSKGRSGSGKARLK